MHLLLPQATVGVAMGSGTDVARESSDVVLIGFTRPRQVCRNCGALRGAAVRIIAQNFVGTLVVDSIGVNAWRLWSFSIRSWQLSFTSLPEMAFHIEFGQVCFRRYRQLTRSFEDSFSHSPEITNWGRLKAHRLSKLHRPRKV